MVDARQREGPGWNPVRFLIILKLYLLIANGNNAKMFSLFSSAVSLIKPLKEMFAGCESVYFIGASMRDSNWDQRSSGKVDEYRGSHVRLVVTLTYRE